MYKLGLINGLVYRDKAYHKENIYISGEEISLLTEHEETFEAERIVDCSGKILYPGFIDPHVHINLDLGEFQSSDDYKSASKIAALGGITTFIDFIEPVNDQKDFQNMYFKKLNEAMDSNIDYSFHTTIGNFQGDIDVLIKESMAFGITSIKVFTTYSESNRRCNDHVLKTLMVASNRYGIIVMCHTENDEMIKFGPKQEHVHFYEDTRPAISEISEVAKLAEIAELTRGNLYFVHVTCGSSVALLKEKFGDLLGKNIFIESCPQYFNLDNTYYKADDNNLYLLAPPLRDKAEQEQLIRMIGTIDTIGTDHCPFTREEKFLYSKISKIPKGIGGLEFSFALMYTLFGDEIVDHFTLNPAKIFGLYPKKGVIEVGSDADIVVFDSTSERQLKIGNGNSDYNPYEGKRVKGVIESTILRGRFIVENQAFKGGLGQYIRRGQ